MLEILFSDSACGSMRTAQHYGGNEKYIGGCISVIISHSDDSEPTEAEIEAAQQEAEEKERLAWENAVPIGGAPADIFSMGLAWSMGSIAEDSAGASRQRVLERLFSIYPDDAGSQAARKMLKMVGENLKIIHRRAAEGEPIRIWYSSQPNEMCGLYWFMAQLKQWGIDNPQINTVRLPEWEADDGNAVQKSGWGEVSPGEWHGYLNLQTPVPPGIAQGYAFRWQELQKEDAPLRAVLNGRLMGVLESFYDAFILREIEAEGDEFKEATVIGRVLGKYQLGIGDAWVALRIEEMIAAGKLKVVSPVVKNMPIYHRRLKKCL